WFALMEGTTERIDLGESFELELPTDELPEPGAFEIIFQTADPLDSTCIVEKNMELTVNPLPTWQVIQVTPAESCEIADGSIEIQALTNIDSLILEETEEVFSLVENEVLQITDLAAGSYTLTAINNGCQST